MSADGARLTERECKVLQLSAAGQKAEVIARALGVAKRTVDEHAAMAVRKLDAASLADAVAIARKNGLIRA
jgi:DNA-binding NarL/FixJ family response regulator